MAIVLGQTTWHWQATENPRCVALCATLSSGGIMVCKSLGTAWIIAPSCADLQRTWYCREDAVTCAKQVTTATSWFIPSCDVVKNAYFNCRSNWGAGASNDTYWSSTEFDATTAYGTIFANGQTIALNKSQSYRRARAIRCVTY